MKVKLNWQERSVAAYVGTMRQLRGLKDGRQHQNGATESGAWQRHIEAAMSEMAVAKVRNVYWQLGPITERHAGDVGLLEVRHTEREDGRLIIQPQDIEKKANRYYVLAVGINGEYDIRGVKLCADCNQEKYWSDPGTGRPAFWVPQSDLEPFDPKKPYTPYPLEKAIGAKRKQSLRQPLDSDEQQALEQWYG